MDRTLLRPDLFSSSPRLIVEIEKILSVTFAGWLDDLTQSFRMPDANAAHGFITIRGRIKASRHQRRQQIMGLPWRFGDPVALHGCIFMRGEEKPAPHELEETIF
jgi:hypothetical protein